MQARKRLNVRYALLSPGISPRAPPGQSTANKLQPPVDRRSRGDRRTPESSPSPAHPGQRHLHREGGGEEALFGSKFTVRHVLSTAHAAFPERLLAAVDRLPRPHAAREPRLTSRCGRETRIGCREHLLAQKRRKRALPGEPAFVPAVGLVILKTSSCLRFQ